MPSLACSAPRLPSRSNTTEHYPGSRVAGEIAWAACVPIDPPSIATFADDALARPCGGVRADGAEKVEPLVQFYEVGRSPMREAIILPSSSGLVIHEHLKRYRGAPVVADHFEGEACRTWSAR